MIVDKPGLCISVYREALEPTEFIKALEKNIEDNFGEDLSWDTSLVGNGRIGQHRTSLSCMLTTLLPPYKINGLSSLSLLMIWHVTGVSYQWYKGVLITNYSSSNSIMDFD